MHLATLVEMVESGFDDRVLLGDRQQSVTGARLGALVRSGAAVLHGERAVVYVGENHPLLPVGLLASAWAGATFVPVNYRLEDHHLIALVNRQPGALILADEPCAARLGELERVVVFDDWVRSLAAVDPADAPEAASADDEVALVLYTSGTTSEPKSALLRHRHLTSYLLGAVEFGSADPDEAVLIAVPPYHIAGVANMLSNLFAGRRLVYLRHFDATSWLQAVRREGITHAMVVPTMLARIVESLGGGPADTPTLRTLSYGGAAISERVLREALRAFPSTGFVNAYGLTETASTIAVLGPEDHRGAFESGDPSVRRRLRSAGRLLPTVEIEIRDEDGTAVPSGDVGMIFLRGPQVSGEYASGSLLDAEGWFCTRDRGHVDADGYLFIEGRADDTIIRGGENIAPAEIEQVLMEHPMVDDACVIGRPDDVWGERIIAVVVPRGGSAPGVDELRSFVRERLRGSKTPDEVYFRSELPHTPTGKLLRRQVAGELPSP